MSSELENYLLQNQYSEVGKLLSEIYQETPERFYSRVIIDGNIPNPATHEFDKYIQIVNNLEKSIPFVKEILDGRLQKLHCLWEKSPSVEGFLEYLSESIQTKYFSDNLEIKYRPVFMTKKDDNRIQLFDLVLKKDLRGKMM